MYMIKQNLGIVMIPKNCTHTIGHMMNDVIADRLGYVGDVPHDKIGNYVFPRAQIEAHPRYSEIIDYLQPDFELYERVRKECSG